MKVIWLFNQFSLTFDGSQTHNWSVPDGFRSHDVDNFLDWKRACIFYTKDGQANVNLLYIV